MLLNTLAASSLGNLLTGKAVKTKMPRKEAIRPCKGTIRTGEDAIRVC